MLQACRRNPLATLQLFTMYFLTLRISPGSLSLQHVVDLPTMSLDGLDLDDQVVKLHYLSDLSVEKLREENYRLFKHVYPTIEPDLKLADTYRYKHCML